jgi:hypothetical protein
MAIGPSRCTVRNLNPNVLFEHPDWLAGPRACPYGDHLRDVRAEVVEGSHSPARGCGVPLGVPLGLDGVEAQW